MSARLADKIQHELGVREPWPADVKLFKPYEVEQILLPDNANCLAVQAFLKMCQLPFQVESRHNAEFMSPSGKVPFIKCGAFVVPEMMHIVEFVNSKGFTLTDQLDAVQKADMTAYMSLVATVLGYAEMYVCWCDRATYSEITKPRYGSVYPWPLNHFLNWQKRNRIMKQLGVIKWANKTLDEVYKKVDECCDKLSQRLENKTYFFGNKPVDLDALVFGHLFAILTTPFPFPSDQLAKVVNYYPTLVEFVKRIEKECFPCKKISSKNSSLFPKDIEKFYLPEYYKSDTESDTSDLF